MDALLAAQILGIAAYTVESVEADDAREGWVVQVRGENRTRFVPADVSHPAIAALDTIAVHQADVARLKAEREDDGGHTFLVGENGPELIDEEGAAEEPTTEEPEPKPAARKRPPKKAAAD